MYETWLKTNQKHLATNINQVKTLLKQHINPTCEPFLPTQNTTTNLNTTDQKQQENNPTTPNDVDDVGDGGGVSSIERLSFLFGLSSFEKQILVLCAAQELDSEVKTLLAEVHGNPNMVYPTFGLALTCFPNAHWSAITPPAPLRRFRLIDLNLNTSTSITNVPLRISERILHYLKGVFYLDNDLQGIIKPAPNSEPPVESHMHLANQILSTWHNDENKEKIPLIQLYGVDETGKLSIAQTTLTTQQLRLWHLPAELIPQKPPETTALAQLWTREAALLGAGLLITTTTTENTPNNTPDNAAQTQRATLRFIEQTSSPIFLSTNEQWQIPNNNPPTLTLQVNKPLKTEQQQLWQTNLQNHPPLNQDPNLQNTISALVHQFNFNASTIKTTINNATQQQHNNKNNSDDNVAGLSTHNMLWESACAVSRPKFLNLAQQITPKATFENLILPEREKQLLKEIIIHVAQRHKVYHEWGFENKNNRGLGISALFSGSSGTGKTMAAEVIAHELHLDLFKIDLSAVVNKYIGETEKNLAKLFDTAEDTGTILFFDEADALFGKRTEIKDSHDRYANIETNYLLQRMENYCGLAILATNLKETLDTAFTRRLKFIINFPFPDEKSRLEIWKNIYPKKTPTNNLNFAQLAKLNIAGGNIQNIALHSAFIAANQNTPINMQHIKQATQTEYTKIEKPLPTGIWNHHENQHKN
ncbi:MAG: ATP-binding protein [Candidatus Bathyarchaeota archaeon]|nr:ATP-binding protein [Candidatus Termiticorpusculum sp.]